MADQARRNGLIVKKDDQFRNDIKISLQDKINQNFSNAGSRLTSIDSLGTLKVRDKILTSFSVHDAKTSLI